MPYTQQTPSLLGKHLIWKLHYDTSIHTTCVSPFQAIYGKAPILSSKNKWFTIQTLLTRNLLKAQNGFTIQAVYALLVNLRKAQN